MTRVWVHDVGHSPVRQILLQIISRALTMSSPLAEVVLLEYYLLLLTLPFSAISLLLLLLRGGWGDWKDIKHFWVSCGSVIVRL